MFARLDSDFIYDFHDVRHTFHKIACLFISVTLWMNGLRELRCVPEVMNFAGDTKAGPISAKVGDPRDVYVYSDNDAKVRAPFDALGLIEHINNLG